MTDNPTDGASIGDATSRSQVNAFSRDERVHTLFRGAWAAAAKSSGLEYRSLTRGSGLANAVRYIRAFRKSRDLKIVFGTSEVLLLAPFARQGDWFVFTGLGRLLQNGGVRAMLVSAFLRFWDCRQRAVVLNRDDKAYLGRVLRGRVSILPGEGYRFAPPPAPAEIGVPLRIGYAGRLLRSKGVDTLIEACARFSGCSLLLMGDLDFGNRDAISPTWLQKEVLEADGRVMHVGFVDNVRERLEDVDLYVSLSDREGLPFGVLDAINAGCALLLSDVPGHREFADMPGVYLVDSKDAARWIGRIAAEPDAFLVFDRQARLQMCIERYGFEAIVAQIKTMFAARDTLETT